MTRRWLRAQDRSRRRLVAAARQWASMAGAPTSSWATQVQARNRAGLDVTVHVTVSYRPTDAEVVILTDRHVTSDLADAHVNDQEGQDGP